MIFSPLRQSAIKNIQPLEKYGRSAHPHTPQTSTGWIFIPLTCRPATEITQPTGNADADDPLTRHKHPASGGFAPLRGIHSRSRAQTPDFPMRRYSGSCNYGMRTVFAQERKARYQRRRFHADAPRRRRAPPRRGPSRRETSGMNLLPNPCCYRRFSSPSPFPWTPLPFPSARA